MSINDTQRARWIELKVMLDANKISEKEALELIKDIDDNVICEYPGQDAPRWWIQMMDFGSVLKKGV